MPGKTKRRRRPMTLQLIAMLIGAGITLAPLSIPFAETILTVGAPVSEVSVRAFDTFKDFGFIYMGAVTAVFAVEKIGSNKNESI